MMISELQRFLDDVVKEYGNLPVYCTQTTDGIVFEYRELTLSQLTVSAGNPDGVLALGIE